MNKITIQDLRDKGWIAYEYVRGSHAYGLNIETSDKDIGGVFILPQDYLMGLRSSYVEQVADEKNDTVFYEFGRWIELLLKSNPTALESLFIPEHCVIGPIHPAVQYIIDNKDKFLSKECFKTTSGYAYGQIKKATGLNKKINWPIVERKTVLDFCYVPYNQGSIQVEKWLAKNGLKQRFCGLVPLPNMHDVYGLYYDFGTHVICEYNTDLRDDASLRRLSLKLQDETQMTDEDKAFAKSFEQYCEYESIYELVPSGFHGIVSENSDSNDVRYEAIAKGAKPIIIMSYNKDGYTCHCKKYKEYKEWEQKRNPIRYESNLKKSYDSKNICHTVRLLHMAKELAEGKGMNVYRTWDRDFLLDIRNHKFEYDYIMEYAENVYNEMLNLIETSTLPAEPDYNEINNMLLTARKIVYMSES